MSTFGREHRRAPAAELLKEILEDLFLLSLHWRSLGTTTLSTLNMDTLGLNATNADKSGGTKPRPAGPEAPPAEGDASDQRRPGSTPAPPCLQEPSEERQWWAERKPWRFTSWLH